MDAEELKAQEELLETIRKVIEVNCEGLYPQYAASLRRDIEGFAQAIIKHWDDEELVDDFIGAIRWAVTKWQWVDVTAKSFK
jgi:hypothetical protein